MVSRMKSSRKRDRFARYFRNSLDGQLSAPVPHLIAPQRPESSSRASTAPDGNDFMRDQPSASPSDIATNDGGGNSYTISVEPIPKDFWAVALAELTPCAQERINARVSTTSGDINVVLEELVRNVQMAKDVSEQKRWTFSIGGKRFSIREQADKMVVFLDRFKQAGDVAVNADPLHAGLPWALLRTLLQTVVSEREQYCALVLGLERVLYFLNRCTIFMEYLRSCSPETNHVRSNLQDALTKLHIRTLRFLLAACDVLERNTIGRTSHAVWKSDDIISFESDCNSIEQRLENAVSDFQRTISQLGLRIMNDKLDQLQNSLEELQKLNEPTSSLVSMVEHLWVQQDQEQAGRILQWTSIVPHEDHHAVASEGRIENTAEWLLSRPEYEEWEGSETSMILWLHGIPGAGKTKLVSRVVDHLITSRCDNEGLAYFYCSQYEESRRTADSILRSYVKQLAIIPGPAKKLHQSLLDSYTEKLVLGFASSKLRMAEIISLMRTFVKSLTRTTLILDALDECHPNDRSEVIETLGEMIKVEPQLKIMISSRRNDDIKRQLRKESNVGVEAQDNEQDIRTFIEKKIEEDTKRRQRLAIRPISATLVKEVVDTLFDRSQGMFQWATLQITQLLRLERDSDIRERLGKLPGDLKQTYDEIMAKIRTQEGSKPEIAIRTFNWMLTGQESDQSRKDMVLSAVCPNPQEDRIMPIDIDVDYILDSCQNLCAIDERGFFRFSHLSVQEYLQEYVCTKREKNEMALNVCLLYLLSRDASSYEKALEITKFACSNWYRYAKALGKDLALCTRSETLLRRFFGSPRAPSWAYLIWLRDATSTKKFQGNDEEFRKILQPGHPEFSACYFGIFAIIQRWIHTKQLDPNQYNRHGIPLLNFAIAGDNRDVVELLLKHGADSNAGGKPLWAALDFALRNNNLVYVKMLLENGADVNASTSQQPLNLGNPSRGLDFRSTTLLATAIGHAHQQRLEIIRLLIESGADVNAMCILLPIPGQPKRIRRYSNSFEIALTRERIEPAKALLLKGVDPFKPWATKTSTNALILASRMEDEELVQMLIDRGIDVNEVRGVPGARESALIAAARQGFPGSMSIMRLLIRNGANFNEGFAPGSAIVAMCEEGRTEVVSLMLDEGEDINLVYDFKTPLIAAVCFSQYQVAQMLLERGADANKIIDGFTLGNSLCVAVHIAIQKKKQDLVHLLLDNGADINSQGGSSGTPLAIATQGLQNQDLMKLLLDSGANVNQRFDGIYNTALEAVLYSFLNDLSGVADDSLKRLDSSLKQLLRRGAIIDEAADSLLEDAMVSSHGLIFDEITGRYLLDF